MRKFDVHMHQTVSCTVTVEVDDVKLEEIALDNEKSVEDLTAADVRDHITDDALDEAPASLCIHCSGYGSGDRFSMDLDGQWEIDDGDNSVEESKK